jgi:hypothetical protein
MTNNQNQLLKIKIAIISLFVIDPIFCLSFFLSILKLKKNKWIQMSHSYLVIIYFLVELKNSNSLILTGLLNKINHLEFIYCQLDYSLINLTLTDFYLIKNYKEKLFFICRKSNIPLLLPKLKTKEDDNSFIFYSLSCLKDVILS